jgi:hypothetical protein
MPRAVNPGAAFKDANGARPNLLGGSSLAKRLTHRSASGSAAGLAEPGASGGGLGRGVSAAPAAALPPRAVNDDLLEGSLAKKPAPSAPAAREHGKAERAEEKEAERSVLRSETAERRRDYAPPPSGWKGGAPAAQPAPAMAAPSPAAAAPPPPPAAHVGSKRKAVSNDALDGLGDSFGGNVPSGAAEADVRVETQKSAPVKASAKKSEPYAAEAPVSAARAAAPRPVANDKPEKAARAPAAQDDEKQLQNQLKSKSDGAGSEAALARRADQLFAAHRWSEAIAAYRELLRRYPEADAESRWRARLKEAQAQADVQQQGPAQAAKAAKAQQKSSKVLQAAPAEAAPAKE